ncbi:MAG: hypothetical protein CL799_08385 [Chromatiales bacterium]|nr:hypothetical protein [Chromatiales bacterium]
MFKQKNLPLALIAVAVAIVLGGTTSTQPTEPVSYIDNNEPLHISELRVYQPERPPAGYRTVLAKPFLAESGKETAARLILLDNGDLDELSPKQRSILEIPNSFRVAVQGEDIEISSTGRQGLIYGLDELISRLELNGGKLYTKSLLDAPDHTIRALHLVIRSLTTSELIDLIDRARKSRFNTLIIQVGDFIRLDARAVEPRPDALSKEQFSSVLDYAKDNGFVVIPDVPLLTTQQKFFKNSFPELLYNELTYDPREPKVYELVFEHLDEVLELFDPPAVHIGHDEVSGTYNLHKKSAIRDEGRILPPDLFLQDVIRLHDYLQSKGVETWMWGDMLVAPEEFPGMHSSNLHGRFGYAQLRPKIPRDIVICAWHYWQNKPDYPSVASFTAQGNPVLGATWKKRRTVETLTRYVAGLPNNSRGMIATTWFHVPRREWDIVHDIIETSGSLFWNTRLEQTP